MCTVKSCEDNCHISFFSITQLQCYSSNILSNNWCNNSIDFPQQISVQGLSNLTLHAHSKCLKDPFHLQSWTEITDWWLPFLALFLSNLLSLNIGSQSEQIREHRDGNVRHMTVTIGIKGPFLACVTNRIQKIVMNVLTMSNRLR